MVIRRRGQPDIAVQADLALARYHHRLQNQYHHQQLQQQQQQQQHLAVLVHKMDLADSLGVTARWFMPALGLTPQ